MLRGKARKLPKVSAFKPTLFVIDLDNTIAFYKIKALTKKRVAKHAIVLFTFTKDRSQGKDGARRTKMH